MARYQEQFARGKWVEVSLRQCEALQAVCASDLHSLRLAHSGSFCVAPNNQRMTNQASEESGSRCFNTTIWLQSLAFICRAANYLNKCKMLRSGFGSPVWWHLGQIPRSALVTNGGTAFSLLRGIWVLCFNNQKLQEGDGSDQDRHVLGKQSHLSFLRNTSSRLKKKTFGFHFQSPTPKTTLNEIIMFSWKLGAKYRSDVSALPGLTDGNNQVQHLIVKFPLAFLCCWDRVWESLQRPSHK